MLLLLLLSRFSRGSGQMLWQEPCLLEAERRETSLWLHSQTPWQEASLLRLFSTRNQGAHLYLRTRIITTSWGQRWLNWKYPSFMEFWPSRHSSRGNRQVVYEQVSWRCAQPESTTGTAGTRDLTRGAKCPLVGFSATLPTHYFPGPLAPSHSGSGLLPGAPSGGFSYLHTWCPPDEKWSCCSKHFQHNPLPAGETESLIWGRWGLPLVLSPLIQLFGILAGWAELWGQGGIWGDSLAVLCTNCLGSPVSSRKTRSEAFWQLPGKRPSWQLSGDILMEWPKSLLKYPQWPCLGQCQPQSDSLWVFCLCF